MRSFILVMLLCLKQTVDRYQYEHLPIEYSEWVYQSARYRRLLRLCNL